MSDTKIFTLEEVATKTDRKECWVIINGKVYDSSKFIDEHPGGIEVILDVGGQDATEAFDDVGHSDEAREILKTLYLGNVKGASATTMATNAGGKPGKLPGNVTPWDPQQGSQGPIGLGSYAFMGIGVATAYFAYQFLMQSFGKA